MHHLFSSQKTHQSASTDIDADDLNLDSDPIVETHEGGEQVYKQQVYLRQYQPPTPEPVEIQVHEILVKPKVQRPPIHVHVGPSRNRDAQRTPSPILIKSAPPQPPPPSDEPVFYNKYVPMDYKSPPQQVCNVIYRNKKFVFFFFTIIRSSFIVILNYHRSHVSSYDSISLLVTLACFLFSIERAYCCRTMASEQTCTETYHLSSCQS